MKQKVKIHDAGLVEYEEMWAYQRELQQQLLNEKIQERAIDIVGKNPDKVHHLIFCEHPHTYTLGSNGNKNHLLANDEFLKNINAKFFHIDRGGDITYHGFGQLVVYPIFDLEYFFTDIEKFIRMLEEAVINTLQQYGITSGRIRGASGVWLNLHKQPEPPRKICAVGIRCARWVVMHGIAINVDVDLSYFNHIIPCGITDKSVGNLSNETGKKESIQPFKQKLKTELAQVFDLDYL